MAARLEFEGVTRRFGAVSAVDGFSLAVGEGEMVTLLGPSGCGKTTALRIAAGLERADSGTVSIDGADATALPPERRGLGMVFQDYSLFPHLTVLDNVAFGLRVRGSSRRAAATAAFPALELLRIPELSERFPHQISGGQRQRVAVARAIAIEPRVLLLDEPLSALDAQVRAELRDEIRDLQRERGFSALFVTHDQEEALRISDTVVVMRDGRIEQMGDPESVYRSPTTQFVARFIGRMNEVPGTVVDAGSAMVAGQRVSVASSRPAGSDTVLHVRPESVRIVRRTEQTGVPGRVESVSFGGPFVTVGVTMLHLEGRVGAGTVPRDGRIEALVGRRDWQDFQTGDEVGLVFESATEAVPAAD